jgi:hypothetical protein
MLLEKTISILIVVLVYTICLWWTYSLFWRLLSRRSIRPYFYFGASFLMAFLVRVYMIVNGYPEGPVSFWMVNTAMPILKASLYLAGIRFFFLQTGWMKRLIATKTDPEEDTRLMIKEEDLIERLENLCRRPR